ncbi:MAG: IPT/TIG domain-containing protein, partial [FCB group bacterium]|nr:IPT/TIG domain-containing protein [FCB group bacterium]
MASRKNLVLASLVSLVMVLSFGIGLVPMLTVGPDQSAKAAPGAAEVAISVDGTTPVGASYAIPVGGEQGFSALRLVGDGVESLGGGTVEWSLATDGSAKLVSAADAAVATVQALAPGEASLYARTSDGLVSIVDLTFYELTAIPQLNGTTVAVTSPLQGARIVVPAGEVTPLTLTAETSNPADVQRVRYVLDAAGTIVQGYSETAPYAVVIPDVLALTSPFVRAEAFSTAAGQYVESTGVTFTVVPVADTDGAGDLDPNGIPDDPFGAGLNPGDQWTSTITDGTFDRTVGMTFLGGGVDKAIVLPEDGVTVTLADPDDATRWVRVTAPAGLVQAGQTGLLLVAIADTPTDLLGATEAANLAVEPSTLVTNGQYVSVNVLIQEGSAWTSLTDVTDNPVVVEMGGLGVTANESVAFAVHPSAAVETGGDTEIQVAPGGSWAKTESGSIVELGEMSAELGTLGVVAPYEFALSPNILSITPATVSSLGGEIRIALENVTNGQAVAVTIAGQVVNGTVDTDGQGTGVTIAVPASAPLATVAATASADVRVDIDGDFDALTGALTYQGPQITNVNPATGGPGETITITGTGFQNAPGTTVLFGDVALTIDSISATEIVGHFGNIIPADGAVDVVVTNANNFSGTAAAGFVVGVDGPVLTDVEPDSVYAGAEYSLNLSGSNFIAGAAKQQEASAAVYFTAGAAPDLASDTRAASISALSDTFIRAKTPATLPAGTYNVYVATVLYTPGEADTVLTSDPLEVVLVDPANAQIQVTSVTPEEGPLAGGTLVTIEAVQAVATAYAEYMKVFFGADEGTIQSASATQIVALTPASTFPSLVDVRVENSELAGPDNFGILADGFEYVQPVLSVSPLSAFSATGPVGGPLNLFTPGSKDFEVSNTGTGTLDWTASVDVTWVSLSAGSGSAESGAPDTVTASLNAGVLALAEGTHTGTITFDDGDLDTDPVTVAVSVVVGPENTPILGVSPATDLVSTGGLGGPFSPTDIDYAVSNTGGGTLNWTASADQAWVTVAPGSGSSTTTATTVNVSINSGANSLAPGLHTATVTFSDGTVQVTRQVELTVVAPVIGVVPETSFDAFGPAGGPFAPLSQTFQVYNFGSGELIWDANLVYTGDAPTWLTLEKDVNAQPGTVVASINDNAGLLTGSAAGTTYSATIPFTGNGGTTTRTV